MTNDIYAHLRREELIDFLNYKLDDENAAYVFRHLKECSSCLADLKKEIKNSKSNMPSKGSGVV